MVAGKVRADGKVGANYTLIETTSKHYVKDSDEHHRKVTEYSNSLFNSDH
jgi:hypothetical protein